LFAGDPLDAEGVQPHPHFSLLQLPNPSTGTFLSEASKGLFSTCTYLLTELSIIAHQFTNTPTHLPAGQQQQYVLTSSGLSEVNRVRHAASSWMVDHSFVSGERVGVSVSFKACIRQWQLAQLVDHRLDVYFSVAVSSNA
jgi:hypothetical protein